MRFDGQVAIVTGGAGVIGEAFARRYLAEGGSVALVDLAGSALDSACADAPTARVLRIAADVTREDDVARTARAAKEHFGRIDFFFANAGIEGATAPLATYPVDVFERVFAVNVTGVFLGLKHVMPLMQDGGSVVITSSTAGLRGTPQLAAYTASKHAVVGLMRTAALEGAARKIRVNTVHPAMVESRMIERLETARARGRSMAEVRQAFEKTIPLARYVKPDEVADIVAFLASDESRMITGSTYLVDGGAMLI